MLQDWLRDPPTIIWGSGATIQYGMPTMEELNQEIKKRRPSFNLKGINFEEALGNCTEREIKQFRKIIWKCIHQRNDVALKRIAEGGCSDCVIPQLVHYFTKTSSGLLNIITTNYDCILEYYFAYVGIPFSRGIPSSPLASFQSIPFYKKNGVNILKVHGSVDWFKQEKEDDVRVLYQTVEGYNPEIIIPGNQKYREAFGSPYREIISKSDEIINNSNNFLVVGFGFNDQHITPRLKARIQKGMPIVVITKRITENTRIELSKASKMITIEEDSSALDCSLVTVRNNQKQNSYSIPERIWQLDKFMEVFV
jgi:hypothetical protein